MSTGRIRAGLLFCVVATTATVAQAGIQMAGLGSFSLSGTKPATGQVGYYGNAVAFVSAGEDDIDQPTLVITWAQTDPNNSARRLHLFRRISIVGNNETPTILATATIPSDLPVAGGTFGTGSLVRDLVYDAATKKLVGVMNVGGQRVFAFDLFSTDVTVSSLSYSAVTGDSQSPTEVLFLTSGDGRYNSFYSTGSANWRRISIGRDQLDGSTAFTKVDIAKSSFTGWYPEPSNYPYTVDGFHCAGAAAYNDTAVLMLRSYKNSLNGNAQECHLYMVSANMDAPAINAPIDLGAIPSLNGNYIGYGMAYDAAGGMVYVRSGYINDSGSASWNRIFMAQLTVIDDPYPPYAITNLAAVGGDRQAVLTWTTPADPSGLHDGAASYDVRYSTSPIDETNWDAAIQAADEPVPGLPGTPVSFTVTGLSAGTTYYFAVKSIDNGGHVSDLSNVAEALTLPPDLVAPAPIADLAVTLIKPTRATLTWTATGDDANVGTATSYDLRYATFPIDASNWDAATPATGLPSPQASGSAEVFTVEGLSPSTTYYFAIVANDEWPNSSPLSNLVTAATPEIDTFPPNPITDLAVSAVGVRDVTLRWTVPADNGVEGVAGYDIRYSTSPIDDANWDAATQVTDAPAPLATGVVQTFELIGLAPNTQYYFAIKAFDGAIPANVAGLSNVVPGKTIPQVNPVTIRNPWITNDRVADTRSLETLAVTFGNAYTPDGVIVPDPADIQTIAINAYNNFKRREYHWADDPPNRGDVVRNINIHGHSLCGGQATQMASILHAMGIGVRTGSIASGAHTLYEVFWDNDWHLMDTMTTMYVFDRSNPPSIASAADIKADKTLMTNAVAEGRACPGFLLCPDDVTWFANGTNSWSVIGTPGNTPVTHSMDMNLRFGEVLDRTWNAWQNQHTTPKTDADGGNIPGPDAPYHHDCQNDWKDTVNFHYWEPYGQVIPYIHTSKTTYRRWSNGTHEINETYRSAGYQAALHSSLNIATFNDDSLTPNLHANTPNTASEVVYKIAVPFYITDASISGEFYRKDANDVVRIFYSNNGTSWTQVWDNTALGLTQLDSLNLRTSVFGKASYYIKVSFTANGAKTDAGVNRLVIRTIFQHNKGAMAYLDKGLNRITVSFDNPEDLAAGGAVLKVTYQWKEFDGTGWTIPRSREQYVATSPFTFSINVGGTKVPRTESIRMEVVAPPPPDEYDPAAVTDLRSGQVASDKVELLWTATGDDGMVDQASFYDLRYSTSPITAENFAAATPAPEQPTPLGPGTAESFRVTGLAASTTYYFAIKVGDEGGNWSDISNIVIATTLPPPPAITDLASGVIGSDTVELTWTATGAGDEPNAAYDLRYSTSPITAENFTAATAAIGVSAPKAAGLAETFTVTGLSPSTTYWFALKARDAGGNASGLSNVISATTMPPDEVAPAWIGDLMGKRSKSASGVDLTWTAPADYGAQGSGPFICTSYQLRYSAEPIDETNFAAATEVAGVPVPLAPGEPQTFTVTGLTGDTLYYFAIKAVDKYGNVSEISNCAPATASVLGEKVLQQGLAGYSGCRDNYSQSGTPTINFGTNERMRVTGYADQGDIQRGYIRFDLSSIPAGTVIRKATLCLYSYDTSKMNGSTGFYEACRITRDWTESGCTYNAAAAGTPWATPGGDFEPVPDALSPKKAPKVPSWYEWDLTARVQEWINAPAGNYGWVIKAQDETSHIQDQFYQANTSNAPYRPKLVISDLPEFILGDIDEDGHVNVFDIFIVAESWNKSLGQRGFDPRCDLDGDGFVNVFDIFAIAENWNR